MANIDTSTEILGTKVAHGIAQQSAESSLMHFLKFTGIPSFRLQPSSRTQTRPPRRRARNFSCRGEIRHLYGPVLILDHLVGRCRQSRLRESLCDADVRAEGSVHHITVAGTSRKGGLQGVVLVGGCSCPREAVERVSQQLPATRRYAMAQYSQRWERYVRSNRLWLVSNNIGSSIGRPADIYQMLVLTGIVRSLG